MIEQPIAPAADPALPALPAAPASSQFTAFDLLLPLLENLKWLIALPLLAGAVGLGWTYYVAPTFTARTTVLPPQSSQGSAASALASLGSLATLAGGTGLRTPADQYVALMQSAAVADKIIEQFTLLEAYEVKYKSDARKILEGVVRISLGKKDGLITIEVDDKDPARAANIANQHVTELRKLLGTLAVTEAQQRRLFFEQQLARTKTDLQKAQAALQASGFNAGALRSEPRAAAEGYARLKAETTAAEIRLQALRRTFSDNAPELAQLTSTVGALRAQLSAAEVNSTADINSDYVSKYREFKYQETLFELFSRQFEAARIDESREGALVQVIDPATTPERRSKPRRSVVAVGTTLVSFVVLALFVVLRARWRETSNDPRYQHRNQRLSRALGRA